MNLIFGETWLTPDCGLPFDYTVANNRVVRGEAILNKLVNADVITPAGRDFLMASLDPMHDNQLQNLAGWPDFETAPSVNRLVKQSQTIQMPTVSGVTNWDAYFISWPWLNAAQMAFGARANGLVSLGSVLASNLVNIGGVSVFLVPSGEQLLLSKAPNYQLSLSTAYTSGANRVIGAGYEIVNTTSDLYRQGQVAVWRETSSPANFTGRITSNSPTQSAIFTLASAIDLYPSPPRSFASAMLLPGTRQWRAADGAYIVIPHRTSENPASLPDYVQPVVSTEETDDKVPNSTVQNAWTTFTNSQACMAPPHDDTTVLGGGSAAILRPQHTYPLHLTGCIFTGLSQQTTLTLSSNVFLETFPNIADQDIIVLAHPSAAPDPLAIKLYAECLNSLPVGVMASENPFGEWFAEVVSSITDFLTPGALALGMPAVAAISKGAGSLANGYLKKKNAEERNKFLTAPSPNQPSLKAERAMIAKSLNPKPQPRKRKKKLNNIPTNKLTKAQRASLA